MTNVNVNLLWKTLDPVAANKGVKVLPTTTLADCPKQVNVLFVPGRTSGVNLIMRDDTVLDFIAECGSHARWVTSVCTGALVLGAAGLLRGYKATAHWNACDLLRIFGATPVFERVVEGRNRITGRGVAAGTDFGMTMSAKIHSEDFGKLAQLAMKDDPHPPFHAGSPAAASPGP